MPSGQMRKFLGERRDHLPCRRRGECRPQEGCQRNQGAPSVQSSNGPTRPGTRGASVARDEVHVFRAFDDRRDVVAVGFAELTVIGIDSTPNVANLSCTAGTASAFRVSACSQSTMARGVFAGKARRPASDHTIHGVMVFWDSLT